MTSSLLSVSWSALRRYEECHQKQLRVSQGRSIPAADGRIFLPGNVADRCMRWFLNQDDPQPGMMAAYVPELLEKTLTSGTEEADDFGRAVIRWRGDPRSDRMKIRNFVTEVVNELEPMLFRLVIPHLYQPELRFETIIQIPGTRLDGSRSSIRLIGGIDIVVKQLEPVPEWGLEVGDYVLYDLKATTDDQYVAKVVGQGIFYDIAWRQFVADAHQPRRFGFIIPATKQQLVWANITDQDRRAMVERIIRFAHGNWKREYEPKESDSGCSTCEVHHACDKFAVHAEKIGHQNRASFEETARRRRTATT